MCRRMASAYLYGRSTGSSTSVMSARAWRFSAARRAAVEFDPKLMIQMLLVGYCFGIRSERRLCEEVHLNLAYRWFCRLDLADRGPGPLDLLQEPARAVPRLATCSATSSRLLVRRYVEEGARWRRAFRRRCQPDRGGRGRTAPDRARGLGPGGDGSRHGAARGPGVSGGSRRRGLRRGEPGLEPESAPHHRSPQRSRPAPRRATPSSPMRPTTWSTPTTRSSSTSRRRAPCAGRRSAPRAAVIDPPPDGPLRPVAFPDRLIAERQRLGSAPMLWAGSSGGGRGIEPHHPRLLTSRAAATGRSSAPTSPTTATPTSTSTSR